MSPPPRIEDDPMDPIHIKTPAERAREESILRDPLANLLSPSLVECKQCKKTIKLSSKSNYDTFHWRNHRARCVKTMKRGGARKPKGSGTAGALSAIGVRPRPPPPRVATLKQSPPKPSPLRSLGTSTSRPTSRRSPQTPPLIPDEEDDVRSERSEIHSPKIPSCPVSPTQSYHSIAPMHPCPTNKESQDYLNRFHPGYTHRYSLSSGGHSDAGSSAAVSAENPNWRSWSWAQLKPPQFITATRYGHRFDEDEDDEDDNSSASLSGASLQAYEPSQEQLEVLAARTLSMLSRSH